MKELIKKMVAIQSELKAPKNQFNAFGKYKYRSCEDILEAVKPLLAKNELYMNITDEVIEVGGKNYIKAIVTIYDGEHSISSSAVARESVDKKGMDDSQISGATSSYSRKYALNAIWGIDDAKDADATNTHEVKKEIDIIPVLYSVSECQSEEALSTIWNSNKALQSNEDFISAVKTKKGELQNVAV